MSRRRSLRYLTLSLAAAVASAILAACSMSADTGGSTVHSISIDLTNYPSTLDPGQQYDSSTYPVYRNIYDQLIRRDSTTLKPIPWIATSWKRVNPTTWNFQLRDDVKFSDGSPLTAEDAAFSLNRILDPDFASAQYANFSIVDRAEAPNATTLIIKTKAPSPALLSYLTTLSIVSKSYVNKVGNEGMNEHPMGSGAYKLKSIRGGSEITLVRNDNWWHAKPDISEVVFRAVTNSSSRMADLQSGQAQLAMGLTPDQADELKGQASLKVLSVPTERVSYLALNTLGHAPTSNLKVREAIASAINYDSLLQSLMGGYAKRVNTVLTPLSFGYPADAQPYTYDPERSKQLLAEAGMRHPRLKFPTSPSYDPQLVQAIQANLQAVGFKVTISNTDQATYLEQVQSPKHDWGSVRFGMWSCSCLDADGVIYPLFHSGEVWSSYSDQGFDSAVEQARTTLDPTQREAAYHDAFAKLRTELPAIGLWQNYAIYGSDKGLHWRPDAVESMYVDQMSLTN